jgi:nitrile hydratase
MNGVHDMGGSHGFGPVVPEMHEPTFHAEWERRVFALTMAAGRPGKWNIDMGRFARENRPPADYLNKSYFEIWLAGSRRCLLNSAWCRRTRSRQAMPWASQKS